jgi:RND superfamily putative drug exporter
VALAQIGTIICVGVLLDTLVVRTVLVPALALLLGDAFWWPRKIGQPRHLLGGDVAGGSEVVDGTSAEADSSRIA